MNVGLPFYCIYSRPCLAAKYAVEKERASTNKKGIHAETDVADGNIYSSYLAELILERLSGSTCLLNRRTQRLTAEESSEEITDVTGPAVN